METCNTNLEKNLDIFKNREYYIKLINTVRRALEILKYNNFTIYNPEILLNNKIFELKHELKDKGLDCCSITGVAMFFELKCITNNLFLHLARFEDILYEMVLNRYKTFERYDKVTNLFNIKLINQIIDKFVPAPTIDLDEDEIEFINNFFEAYDKLCSIVWDYKIDNRLINTISNYLINKGYLVEGQIDMALKMIENELYQLGMENLFPEIKANSMMKMGKYESKKTEIK